MPLETAGVSRRDSHTCPCGARVIVWDKDDRGCTWLSTDGPREQGCYSVPVIGVDGEIEDVHVCSEACAKRVQEHCGFAVLSDHGRMFP